MTLFIGADHRGIELKNAIIECLHEKNIRIEDIGPYELNLLDDVNFGKMGSEAIEIALKVRHHGGRVVVNFNHPLSGKEVVYTFKIRRKIDDAAEQITSFLSMSFKIPEKQMKVQVQNGKATVELPVNLPPPLTDALMKKLAELTGVKEIEFRVRQEGK